MRTLTIITDKISLEKLNYYHAIFAQIGYRVLVIIK